MQSLVSIHIIFGCPNALNSKLPVIWKYEWNFFGFNWISNGNKFSDQIKKVRTFETAFKSIAESKYTAPINASKQLGMIGGTSNMKFFLSRKYNWTNNNKLIQ